MPPASGAGDAAPARRPPAAPADPVLAAEQDHLRRSREFLRLMRENVLGLRAMAGDRESEEYLKADLHRRAEALRDLPDVPLFFGRLDYADNVVMHPGDWPAGPGQPAAPGDGGDDGGDAGAARPGGALPGERLHIG